MTYFVSYHWSLVNKLENKFSNGFNNDVVNSNTRIETLQDIISLSDCLVKKHGYTDIVILNFKEMTAPSEILTPKISLLQ